MGQPCLSATWRQLEVRVGGIFRRPALTVIPWPVRDAGCFPVAGGWDRTGMEDDYRTANRASWDERVPAHAASPDYQLEQYAADPGFLSEVVRFDLPRLGTISGLRGVHLQCHIGTDTVSLARLGASMTGLDFSAPAKLDSSGSARKNFCNSADAFWRVNSSGRVEAFIDCLHDYSNGNPAVALDRPAPLQLIQQLPSGAEVWKGPSDLLLAGHSPENAVGKNYVARVVPPDFLSRLNEIQKQSAAYDHEKQNLRALKRQLLLILFFFTVLLLSPVLWLALYLAKQVTVPIQALAEGTREVSSGNFEYQVPEQVHDELGALVRSFNTMTTQLRDSRSQIDQFTRNLQQAVQELERRRQLMETVLENIPTGVLSLDKDGNILRANPAATGIFGASAKNARTLEELVGPDDARAIRYLFRRALRTGVVSRELEIIAGGRVMHAAVTVSALGPRRANSGFVLVLDDLTELLRAQKAAAWQEVARRIAHEIKNPLTPIQLSAQRLSRYLEKHAAAGGSPAPIDPELRRLVEESSRLIEREVGTLSALVNEFSQFVRFPSAKLESADVNHIVREAIDGATAFPLMAAAENWPATPWLQPWQPPA